MNQIIENEPTHEVFGMHLNRSNDISRYSAESANAALQKISSAVTAGKTRPKLPTQRAPII